MRGIARAINNLLLGEGAPLGAGLEPRTVLVQANEMHRVVESSLWPLPRFDTRLATLPVTAPQA
jgi:hypothetical protein